MRKELVSVKDIRGYWANILCISCSEGKNISTFEGIVENLKECQEQLSECEFEQIGEEVYVYVDDMTQINPGDKCK